MTAAERIAGLDKVITNMDHCIEVLSAIQAERDAERELEQADKQRELVFNFNQSMEAKESA
jgi:hypothetical protein